jgi:hypothetical protein
MSVIRYNPDRITRNKEFITENSNPNTCASGKFIRIRFRTIMINK